MMWWAEHGLGPEIDGLARLAEHRWPERPYLGQGGIAQRPRPRNASPAHGIAGVNTGRVDRVFIGFGSDQN